MAETAPRALPRLRLTPRSILILGLVVLVLLFVTGVVSPVGFFDIVLLQPILNLLVLLSGVLWGSFGFAIIILTILVRVITLPLTMRQLHSTRAMQTLQPKMKELQKKYAKDQQRLNQEMMKLYKEEGVNPLGCAFPMLIQFPIWIGVYQAVIQGLGYAPENLLGLSKQLYNSPLVQQQVPLNSHFLGLDLLSGNIIMAVLVAVSMWVLQKMSTPESVDPQQQQMSRIMIWLMPLMFGFFAMSFPSGLSLYWVLTNLIGIVIQYRVTGWGTLKAPSLASVRARLQQPLGILAPRAGIPGGSESKERAVSPAAAEEAVDSGVSEKKRAVMAPGDSPRKKVGHGKHRDKRKVRRRSR